MTKEEDLLPMKEAADILPIANIEQKGELASLKRRTILGLR